MKKIGSMLKLDLPLCDDLPNLLWQIIDRVALKERQFLLILEALCDTEQGHQALFVEEYEDGSVGLPDDEGICEELFKLSEEKLNSAEFVEKYKAELEKEEK